MLLYDNFPHNLRLGVFGQPRCTKEEPAASMWKPNHSPGAASSRQAHQSHHGHYDKVDQDEGDRDNEHDDADAEW